MTSSIIHLHCHLFWHQIRKFYKNNQKLAIFFTWSCHEVLNLDFLVSVNILYMLLSFKKISFGVQFYKHRRVAFIPIVMNQVYKSLRGVMASLSLSQKCISFSKPTIFHPQCVKYYSDSKYTTYRPIQWILRKLQPFKDIKDKKSD